MRDPHPNLQEEGEVVEVAGPGDVEEAKGRGLQRHIFSIGSKRTTNRDVPRPAAMKMTPPRRCNGGKSG